MVNSDNEVQFVRNGRRSRPTSPITLPASNGHASASAESSFLSPEKDKKKEARIGRDYQASLPPFIQVKERRQDQLSSQEEMMLWFPSLDIQNTKLDEFVRIAQKKYGLNVEQALGILFWHEHDLDSASEDLDNITPFPNEWSVEDKVIFEQAFQFHGKYFRKIHQMMPDKKIGSLIDYYYSWDKIGEYAHHQCPSGYDYMSQTEYVERNKKSLMDLQEIKLNTVRHRDGGLGGGYGEENYPDASDEEKEKKNKKPKHSSKPPNGMHINHDDLVALATGPPGQGDQLLTSLDQEIVSYKRTVRNNKQLLSSLRSKIVNDDDERPIGQYRASDPARINSHWTNEELLLAVQGVKKFGKNFKTIAEVLGTKTESHVRSFFVNYKKKYNLDNAYKEYEAEYGPTNDDDDIQVDMEKEGSGSSEIGVTINPSATNGVADEI